MQRTDVVYSLITNESKTKVVMVKNRESERWTLPGGAVEREETLEQAAIREAKEETGLDIAVYGVVAVNEYRNAMSKEHIVLVTFRAEIAGGQPTIVRPDEIMDIDWIELRQADLYMPYYKEGVSGIVERSAEITYFDEGLFER